MIAPMIFSLSRLRGRAGVEVRRTRGGLLALILATALGGCMQTLGGSVAGGECKVFERPAYVVRGARPYDQDWIDSTIEGGVGGCHWRRPAPRPPEIDARPAPKAAAAAKPAKKRGFIRRLRDRTWPKTSSAPIAPPPPEINLPAPAVPLPKPRSAIDELLFPSQ